MSDDPCCHPCDWTDGDIPDVTDLGCCAPLPIRITCEAPVLPTPECDEADPIITYDEATEEFTVLTTLYDSECSALLDSNLSPLLSLIQ